MDITHEENCSSSGKQLGDASRILHSLMNQLPTERVVSVTEATSLGTGQKQVEEMLPVKTVEPVQTANSEIAAALSLPASQQQQVISTSMTTSGSNPLQVSIKTVPGANTVVNQALINNIVNSDAVQTLLRDNPGQPITIVRMPDTMQIPRFNFPLTPLNNLNWNNLKTRKRTGSQLSSRGRRGRKPKLGDVEQERTDVLQFQKSLQFKTRSGRVSKPPLYRVKETLQTPKSDLADQNSKATVTNERIIGTDPLNGMSDADEVDKRSERSPLEMSGRSTLPHYTLRGQTSTRRGFRGYSRNRRSRARVGNHGNRLSPSGKLKELLTEISDDDFVSVALPKLSEIISCWEFLMMGAHVRSKKDPKQTPPSTILEEFNDILHEIRSMSTMCLHPVPEEGVSLDSVNTFEVSDQLAEALGKRRGSYLVEDIPASQIPARVANILNTSTVPEGSQSVVEKKSEDGPENVTDLSEKPFEASSSRKLADRILGVDTIFPDNALKSKQTTAASGEASSSLPTLNEKSFFSGQSSDSTEEASSLMEVHVEELDSGGLHPVTSDLNLQQAVQSTDTNVLSGQDTTGLKESSIQTSTSVLDIEPAEVDHTGMEGLPAESLTRTGSFHQSTNAPMVPEGSTIMQMADGNFLVQKPDGTAMQIQAPEGMTIETIQALLSMETEVFEGDQTETEIPPLKE